MSVQVKHKHLNSFRCDYSEDTKNVRMDEIDDILKNTKEPIDVIQYIGKYYLNTYHFHGEQGYFGFDFVISKDEAIIAAKKLNQVGIPNFVDED